MVSYIVDESGNKTHAVVPIREWEKIKEDIYFNEDKNSSYPEEHISKIINFLKDNNNQSIQSWKAHYEEYYNYYNKLDFVDFMVLYLYRSGFFGVTFSDEIYENIDMNKSDLFLTHIEVSNINYVTKNDDAIDWKVYKDIRDNIAVTTEQEFLMYFHSKVKFTSESIEYFKQRYKRVHKNAERDRLFVYDIYILFGSGFVNTPKKLIFKDIEKSQAQYIAKHLYKDNISQVYRAGKEAQERIALFN